MPFFNLFARALFILALGYTAINANAEDEDDSVDNITEYTVIVNEIYDEIVVTHRQEDNCHLVVSQTLSPLSEEQPRQPEQPSAAIILPETFFYGSRLFDAELWPPSYSSTLDYLYSPSSDEGVIARDTLQMLIHKNLIEMATEDDDQHSYPIILPMGPIEIQNKNQLYVIDPIIYNPVVTIYESTASASANKPSASGTGTHQEALPSPQKKGKSRAKKRTRDESHTDTLAEHPPRPAPAEEESSAVASSESTASDEDEDKDKQGHYQFQITGVLHLGIETPCTPRTKKNRKRKKTVEIPVTILVSSNPADGTVEMDSLSSSDSKYAINIVRKPSQACSSVVDKSFQAIWEVVKKRAFQKIMSELKGPQIYSIRRVTESAPTSETRTRLLTPQLQIQVVEDRGSMPNLVDVHVKPDP
ncbi:hypothetical protein [Endozoicomonas sp. 4G]|uniref:hypothetical protein n=1 Tax=Endozoicomonas sp. 4G TaxID=2872754 RepID=UPI002078F601|nr:hypothetical protein [Endozoicomonas sp. 4G]